MPRLTGLNPNLAAALDTVAFSELGAALLAATDDGYNVLVGATASEPLLFPEYSRHPDLINYKFNSTAAGRYQIIHATWRSLQAMLNLPDFGPVSQDRAALELIREKGAVELFSDGHLRTAIAACSPVWASLPGSTAGQHLQQYRDLEAAFVAAGGTLA